MANNAAKYGSAIAITIVLSGYAQPVSAEPAALQPRDAITELPPTSGARITVNTLSWNNGGDIPTEDTQFGSNAFPGLIWSNGPQGTKSYAVIAQDSDAFQNGEPLLHLTLYNIPSDATRLHVGMVPEANPRGSSYGPNYAGYAQPYLGPHPPPGPKHHYHFQVFALDATIPPDPRITYDRLVSAMRGHVLASGEVVGTSAAYSKPTVLRAASTAGVPAADVPQASELHRHQY
jgi:para-nitrobenzyl esterase